MITSRSFLQQIEDFLKRSGFTASAFGKGVARDPSFVGELRRGRQPTLAMVERVHAFMAQHDRDVAEDEIVEDEIVEDEIVEDEIAP
jgi:hypothetical protein